MEQEKKLARERASIILQVRSGALPAKEGAERLGISRKTYYEWEDRALQAMAQQADLRTQNGRVKWLRLLGARAVEERPILLLPTPPPP